MKTNMLALLAIMGILMTGTVSGQQFAYAQSGDLKVEIEIEDGFAKVEVESEDDEYEFRLATSDIDEILEITSIRTGISIGLLESAMELEIKNDSDADDGKNDQKDERDDEHNATLERNLHVVTFGNSSEIKIELEFVTETTDFDLLLDEILEKFLVTQEEAENTLQIKPEDDNELEEKFDVEIETENDITEVEVELRYVLDSVNRDEIIAAILEQSQLDRERLANVIEIEETIEEDSDDSDSFIENSSDDTPNNSEIEILREENQRLREEVNDLREQLANLNQVLMEQIRVIMDTLASIRP